MKLFHIVYHNDMDGVTSAAIIYEFLKNKFGTKIKETIRFYSIDYTIKLEDIINLESEEDEFYFLDYSFSNEDNLKYMLDLYNNNYNITWIDHHKTSVDIINTLDEKYKDINAIIDMNYCGAKLCYKYAFMKINKLSFVDHDIDYPKFIEYVNSYDIWLFNQPNTEEFHYGFLSLDLQPKTLWSTIFKFNAEVLSKLFKLCKDDNRYIEDIDIFINNCINKGKIILEYNNIHNKNLCNNNAYYTFIIVNSTSSIKSYLCCMCNNAMNSKGFGSLIDYVDIVMPFTYNGEYYKYSLFTKEKNIDCSVLAKILGNINKIGMGGGGHIKAAGFQLKENIFTKDSIVEIHKCKFKKDKYKYKKE